MASQKSIKLYIYKSETSSLPLQRSYSITDESISAMLQSGALKGIWDDAKVAELEELGTTITGKDQKKLDAYYEAKPVYDAILNALENAKSDSKWLSPSDFEPVLIKILADVTSDKKLIGKILDGLSVMDKTAEIQRDKKGNIIYDKTTKDSEIVKWGETIEDYMAREVLPHVPDAQWFWEEDLSKKTPVIRTGAEIPFTRYFYKYQQPIPSEELEVKFTELELSVSERIAKLFGEV